MLPRIFTLALIASSLAYGQLLSNTVTITASRTLNVQPDQIVFGVTVNSGIGTSLTTVLSALQPVGISAANLSSVTTGTFQTGVIQTTLVQWSFTLPAAFASMQSTVTALTNLQQNFMQNDSGLTLSFLVEGTQLSQQLQQMQVCPLADLLSDAQTQARSLASTAGFSVGSVVAMSSSTSSGGVSITAPVCSMTVKFSLVQ
jgi:hypothetical protein